MEGDDPPGPLPDHRNETTRSHPAHRPPQAEGVMGRDGRRGKAFRGAPEMPAKSERDPGRTPQKGPGAVRLESPVRSVPKTSPKDAEHLREERTAILEIDGGLSRLEAELRTGMNRTKTEAA